MLAALKTPDLTAMQRLVYVVIVGWADGDHCRTTVQAIADQLSHGTQRATVYRAVEAIEQMGLIRSEKVAHGVFRYQLLEASVLASEQRPQPRKSTAKHAESGRLPPLSVSPRYILNAQSEPTAKNGGDQPPIVSPGYNGALYHHDTTNGGSPPNTVSLGYKPADASDCITTIQETAELSQNVYHQDTNADCIPEIQKSAEVSHSLYPQDTIPCARVDSPFLLKEEREETLLLVPGEKGKGKGGTGGKENPNEDILPTSQAKLVLDAWNEMAARSDLPCAKTITPKRRQRIRDRLREHGMDGIREAIERIDQSDFCHGANNRAWKADFDFLLQEDSLNCAREGRYDNRTPKLSMSQATGAVQILNQLRQKREARQHEENNLVGVEQVA